MTRGEVRCTCEMIKVGSALEYSAAETSGGTWIFKGQPLSRTSHYGETCCFTSCCTASGQNLENVPADIKTVTVTVALAQYA